MQQERSGRISVRSAQERDVPLILRFIHELAEYERLTHEVRATEAQLRASLFGPRPYAECVLGSLGDRPVGFALFFHNFSTFLAQPGIYLEDLYVEPDARGKGVGEALFLHVARAAHDRGCGRFEWSVLDWNEPAIGFYRRLGASAMSDWTVYRIDAPGLVRLAQRGQ